MLRDYKCLSKQQFSDGRYQLVPVRAEDRFDIMTWRNEQIDVLRQKQPLTRAQQDDYFERTIARLFTLDKPDQILFSFLEDGILIGYGGLVHIDWDSKNAEVSFLTKTDRARNTATFIQDWHKYLSLLKDLVSSELRFRKIFTFAYDIRPHLYEALTQSFFKEEARLSEHVLVLGEVRDVLIHSYFFQDVSFRLAKPEDMMLYFGWANDALVRKNSFNQAAIDLESHEAWFAKKISSPSSVFLVAIKDNVPVGQIRFEENDGGHYEIGFSVDHSSRGRGFGKDLVRRGVEEFFKLRPRVSRVIAKVKADNLPSVKSFEKIGFKKADDRKQIDVFTYYFDRG